MPLERQTRAAYSFKELYCLSIYALLEVIKKWFGVFCKDSLMLLKNLCEPYHISPILYLLISSSFKTGFESNIIIFSSGFMKTTI